MSYRFKSTIGIIAAMMCMLNSCVENERNPFEDIETQEDGKLNVKLPGYVDIYVGSMVELRGSGFSASDRIYVNNRMNGATAEARIEEYTDEKLVFVMPGGTDFIDGGDVDVSIERNGATHFIGTVYAYPFPFEQHPADDQYHIASDIICVYGEQSGDNKLYYQEISDYGELLGEPIELTNNNDVATWLEEHGIYEYSAAARVNSATQQYRVIFEHNGETAIDMQTYRTSSLWFDNYAERGESVTLQWTGFRDSDLIGLAMGDEVITINNPIINESGLTFTVPQDGIYSSMQYEIRLLRYDNNPIIIGNLYIN